MLSLSHPKPMKKIISFNHNGCKIGEYLTFFNNPAIYCFFTSFLYINAITRILRHSIVFFIILEYVKVVQLCLIKLSFSIINMGWIPDMSFFKQEKCEYFDSIGSKTKKVKENE